MSSQFDIREFMEAEKEEAASAEQAEPSSDEIAENEIADAPELDVQKAVVESLAADKAELDCQIDELRKRIAEKDSEIRILKGSLKAKDANIIAISGKLSDKDSIIADLRNRIADLQEKEFDLQERNPNALALLDRDVDIPDRFPGETRDHVLEVIREARAAAEREGRVRRAQVLEGVLVANEPNGALARKRGEIEKLFADNGNIVNGIVLAELLKRRISHKDGEDYLLPSEILKRNF